MHSIVNPILPAELITSPFHPNDSYFPMLVMEVPESEMLISLVGEAKLPFTFFDFVAGSNNEINRQINRRKIIQIH